MPPKTSAVSPRPLSETDLKWVDLIYCIYLAKATQGQLERSAWYPCDRGLLEAVRSISAAWRLKLLQLGGAFHEPLSRSPPRSPPRSLPAPATIPKPGDPLSVFMKAFAELRATCAAVRYSTLLPHARVRFTRVPNFALVLASAQRKKLFLPPELWRMIFDEAYFGFFSFGKFVENFSDALEHYADSGEGEESFVDSYHLLA